MIAQRLATLYELQTIYSVEDLHDLLEVIIVEGANVRGDDPR